MTCLHRQTLTNTERLLLLTAVRVRVCCAVVQPTLGSLCPALIHLPTRYYRDTAEKNAKSRLVDWNTRRAGLNLNNKEETSNTKLRVCYITLLQDPAMKSTTLKSLESCSDHHNVLLFELFDHVDHVGPLILHGCLVFMLNQSKVINQLMCFMDAIAWVGLLALP